MSMEGIGWREAHELLLHGSMSARIGLMLVIGGAGASMGSFVAAAAYRLRSDSKLNIAWPPSMCEGCGRNIRWWENLPLVSYVVLRGRCSVCHQRIRVADYLCEVVGAITFPLLVVGLGPGMPLLRVLVSMPLFAIGSLVDLHEHRIPLEVTWTGIVLGLGLAALDARFLQHLAAAIAIALFLGGLDRVYSRLRRVETGIGGGDVRLAAAIGAFAGPAGVGPAVFVAAFVGATVGLARMALGHGNLQSKLPFGPFLAFGGLLVLIAGADVFRWLPIL